MPQNTLKKHFKQQKHDSSLCFLSYVIYVFNYWYNDNNNRCFLRDQIKTNNDKQKKESEGRNSKFKSIMIMHCLLDTSS